MHRDEAIYARADAHAITLTAEEVALTLDLVRGNIAGTEEWWRKHANQKLDGPNVVEELARLRAFAARLEAAL